MQIFEEEMKSLRRAIQHWLDRVGWRTGRASAEAQLSQEVRMPADLASSILDRTAADLRKLSTSGEESFDARPIIDRAVKELGQLGYQSRPFEEAVMERYLEELPEADYQILCHFKQGKKHGEIAELMGTDVTSVRNSLIKTYAELRFRMISSSDGDGGGLPQVTPPCPKSLHEPMKRTSLHHN